ncbi:MAG: tetratricopeptide repeat protein [Verrucomicrobiota bacterium]
MIWNSRNFLFRATLLSCILLTRMEVYPSSEPALNSLNAERYQTYSPTVNMELGDRSELLAQAQALYAEAVRVESSRGFLEAQPLYEKVLTLDPSFSMLQWRMAYNEIQQNQPQQALSIILRGLEANPKSTTLKALASWTYSLLRQHREAIRVAKDVLSQNFEEIYAYRALYESQKALGLDADLQSQIKNASLIPSTKVKFWTDLALLYTELLIHDSNLKKNELVAPIAPLYKKALSLDPENSDLFKQYGDFYQKLDDGDQALAIYQKGVEFQPDDLDLLLRIGRIQHRQGNTKEAYQTFEKAYQLRPDSPMLRELVATMALQMGNFERAISLNEELVFRNPKNEAAHRTLLGLYEKHGMKERAIAFYERMMTAGSSNDLVLDSLDDFYQKGGLYPRGIAFFEKWVQDHPHEVRPFVILTNYYEREQILEQKITFFQDLIHQHPEELTLYTILTLIFERVKRWDDAEKVYENLMAKQGGDIDFVENYLMLLIRQKKYARAEDVMKEAKNRFPDVVALGVLEGIIFRDQKKYDQALAVFDSIQKKFEGDKRGELSIEFYLEMGMTQELATQHDLAEKTFQKGLDRAPQDFRIQNALAYLWADQGIHLDEALVLSKKSLETRPKEGSYMDTLAWIHFKKGNLMEALPILEEARVLTQEEPEVLEHLAEVYQKLGRESDSLALWEKILEKDNSYPRAKEKAIALQEELKQSKAHVKSSP